MNKRIKIIIIIFLILITLSISVIEVRGFKANKKINEFINRGEYVTTINKVAYYKVLKKYDYENLSDRVIDRIDDIYVGTIGDIYISNKDPLDFFVTKYISNNLRIGHSAVVNSIDAQTTIEVTGNEGKKNNIVKEYENTWFQKYNSEITVLRVKGITEENKKQIINWLNNKIGLKYNYFFFRHAKQKYYCLDICSRLYESLGIDIDGKKIITYGSSMISDKDTYIIYYKKRVNSNDINYKVYFLSEE